MIITPALLVSACEATPQNAALYALPLRAACDRYSINTPQRVAAFLAQIGHESGSLSASAESFNYAIPALMATFPRAMPFALASKYGRQPTEKAVPLDRQKQIASIVYANKYGNGDTTTGDGWNFRGSGLVQTTFRSNFEEFAENVNIDLVSNPDRLRNEPDLSALSAGFFWSSKGLNLIADGGNFDALTRRINPAMAGKPDRDRRFALCRHALGLA